jgi:hypothetical protein
MCVANVPEQLHNFNAQLNFDYMRIFCHVSAAGGGDVLPRVPGLDGRRAAKVVKDTIKKLRSQTTSPSCGCGH